VRNNITKLQPHNWRLEIVFYEFHKVAGQSKEKQAGRQEKQKVSELACQLCIGEQSR
jgi:hypothetical protein